MASLTIQTSDGTQHTGDDWEQLLTSCHPDADPRVTLMNLISLCRKMRSIDVTFGQPPDLLEPLQVLHRLHECRVVKLIP